MENIAKWRDKLDQTCDRCKEGTYVEESIFDDIENKVTCNNCYYRVTRVERITHERLP